MRFSTFLENERQYYPWQATSAEELLKFPNWTKHNSGALCYVNPEDGVIAVTGSFMNKMFVVESLLERYFEEILIEHNGKHYIPFQMKANRHRDYKIFNTKLSSYTGFPDICSDFISYDNQITSFDGIPSIIQGDFVIQEKGITTWEGFSNYVRQIDGVFYWSSRFDKPLELFKIHLNPDKIRDRHFGLDQLPPEPARCLSLVAQLLKDKASISEATEALFNAGLKDYI